MNMYLSIPEPRIVSLISQPPKIAQNWFCIQNLHMYLSFQKKKNGLEICSLIPEILNKQTFEHFFEMPCMIRAYIYIILLRCISMFSQILESFRGTSFFGILSKFSPLFSEASPNLS